MMLLFVSLFFASIIFLIFFLMNLPDDLKKESLRPIFAIVPALGFWIFTLPGLLAPELATSISGPSGLTTITSSGLPQGTYNAFFTVWLTILILIFFLILLWYILLLRQKTARLLKEGANPLHGLEKQWGRPGG